MQTQSYSYNKRFSTRYTFISKGKKGAIVKLVEFTPTSVTNILNLGFGDLHQDGSVDDTANSNNEDIIKVFATIVAIIEDFTNEYPEAKIVFIGSTTIRTMLYQRILRMYYSEFNKRFILTALKEKDSNYVEVPFEIESNNNYVAFFVKRK